MANTNEQVDYIRYIFQRETPVRRGSVRVRKTRTWWVLGDLWKMQQDQPATLVPASKAFEAFNPKRSHARRSRDPQEFARSTAID